MTKTYNVNGRKIEAKIWVDDDGTKYLSSNVEPLFLQLLEALDGVEFLSNDDFALNPIRMYKPIAEVESKYSAQERKECEMCEPEDYNSLPPDNDIVDEIKGECICSNYKRGQTTPLCPVCDKKEECEGCKFDKLPGEYTLPFVHEIPHSCKEDKKEEPKSECKHNDPYRSGAGTCRECGLHYEEPKSTLKEDVCEIMLEWKVSTPEKQADKILSLFKDTLLKEIEKQGTRIAPEDYDIPKARQAIINIIQNL